MTALFTKGLVGLLTLGALAGAALISLQSLPLIAQDTNPTVAITVGTNAVPAIPITTTDSANIWALINAMVEQIVNSPASLLVIIGLSILAYVFEVSSWLPTKAILPVCVFGGAVSYWMFSSVRTVPSHFPYPFAVLVVNGLVCGLFAFVVHATVVKWIVMKFQPSRVSDKKATDDENERK